MKKILFYASLCLLIIFECLRVYLIMPLPGSQQFNSINLAYFLGSNKIIIRTILIILMSLPLISLVRSEGKNNKIKIYIGLIIYLVIFYLFNFQMEADQMFLQPKNLQFATIETNIIPAEKLVLGVEINGETRGYPIQLIGYHHQVRDTIQNTPILVTYCTVCRTGRIFNPAVNGTHEQFRLVGMDHFNAMFEDATTKSWWRQANGECIAGPLKGYQLEEIPSEQVRLSVWLRQHPDSKILQPDQNFKEEIDRMDPYDLGNSKSKLTKRDSLSWGFKSWVIGVDLNNEARTYDWNLFVQKRLIQDSLSNIPLLLVLESDTASFHVYNRTVEAQTLHFSIAGDSLTDAETGSVWNMDGKCVRGINSNKQLSKIPAYQEFLHSWEYFHANSKRFNN
jgi:hypothetical protein